MTQPLWSKVRPIIPVLTCGPFRVLDSASGVASFGYLLVGILAMNRVNFSIVVRRMPVCFRNLGFPIVLAALTIALTMARQLSAVATATLTIVTLSIGAIDKFFERAR
jgi:hypothetical protein